MIKQYPKVICCISVLFVLVNILSGYLYNVAYDSSFITVVLVRVSELISLLTIMVSMFTLCMILLMIAIRKCALDFKESERRTSIKISLCTIPLFVCCLYKEQMSNLGSMININSVINVLSIVILVLYSTSIFYYVCRYLFEDILI